MQPMGNGDPAALLTGEEEKNEGAHSEMRAREGSSLAFGLSFS